MTDTTPSPGGAAGGEIGYAAALAELEDILDELDGDEVDVDVLGARVRRAAELLRLCRERIAGARFEVEQVVAELEAEADAAATTAGVEPVTPETEAGAGASAEAGEEI
ncbi:MAG TPA: exodeoxyribonuclease VII small subunit [Acidimicrobiales bacterium]|nr:exodeoxyribonuclease VII small subunit [Acidimicrobiales bacterium]